MSGGFIHPDSPVDLSNCDREPIHIPGTIQPHGVLLAVTEPDLVVVQASTNSERLLGIAPGDLLGANLPSILDTAGTTTLARALEAHSFRQVNGLPVAIGDHTLDAILHRSEGLLIVELETHEEQAPGTVSVDANALNEFTVQARNTLRRLQRAGTLAALWPTLAKEMRDITGFDRVMVYRFSERDGSGEVIAEDRREDLEPYLGLHYPATDIPQQARYLYVLNRLRIIPDAAYTPVPITPADNPLTGRRLDLSHAALRSVSPIHCEYLANMGVRASMSISLVKDEQLWGLIACHHTTPRRLPYRLRALCELLGDVCSWMLGPRIESEENRRRMQTNTVQRHLMEAMSAQPDLMVALTTSMPSLLDMVEASGFAVAHEGKLATLGKTPSQEQLDALVRWLSASMEGPVYATDALPGAYPPAHEFKDEGCGLLATAVSKAQGLFLMWFRPELVYEVRWGGDPRKPVDVEGERLTPRKSFAMWKETVRLRSRPWAAWEHDAATEMRNLTATVVLQQAAEIFRLNIGLEEALHSRDEFLSMASHELKTPMQTLTLQLEALAFASAANQLTPGQLGRRLATARRQVARLDKLVSQLLDVSRISGGRLELDRAEVDLGVLAREVAGRFSDDGVPIHLDTDGDTTGWWDEFRLDQVLTNLLSNAIKYGRGQPVDIIVRDLGESVRCSVRDRGMGIAFEEQARLFERFERAVPSVHFAGFGLGLWITRQIIERHGGSIEVESSPDRGATFTFTLPRAAGGPIT